MRLTASAAVLLSTALLVGSCQQAPEYTLQIPVDYFTLDNGLRVVLSRDDTAPLVRVAVYYGIGFRIEPQDRTGFAHLFEHMMFQGSQNLGKMEFIRLVQMNGGSLNGSTRFDFTNYFQTLPAHKLETILWAEADRMRGLDLTQENLVNQQAVVKNEVKVNVLNQPYGGFPWLDMPRYANTNWYNAHNFYGDLEDLDAATLEDVKQFFTTYYTPNNAVLVVTGLFDPEAAREMIAKYFEDIPSSPRPAGPDLTEPRQEESKRVTKMDRLITHPRLAIAYLKPERDTPVYYAMGLLDQILLQGRDSRLHQALVQKRGLTNAVRGGVNPYLGTMFDYNGPMLWCLDLYHDPSVPAEAIVAVVDSIVESLASSPVDEEALDRAKVKFRSSFYDMLGSNSGIGTVHLLACFALFDDDPDRINQIDSMIDTMTPEILQQTAAEYLRKTNQTVLAVVPAAGS